MAELEYQITETLPKEYFERILFEGIMKMYKPSIRKNYRVAGFAQIQTGEYVVCLRRTLKSFEPANTASTPTGGDSPVSEISLTGEVAPSNQVEPTPPTSG